MEEKGKGREGRMRKEREWGEDGGEWKGKWEEDVKGEGIGRGWRERKGK